MPETSPPLRIAVVGVGAIGSAFAFHLAGEGGHDVTVVARPGSARLSQLTRDGAIVDVHGARAPVRVAGVLDEEAPYDLLIVTVLAHQALALLPALQRSAAGCVQFMFNTFEPERLQAAVGAERCAFGMPFIQATLDLEGRFDAKVGAGGQKTIMDRRRWIDVFSAAGLPAKLEPDMPLWLRCHAPICVAFESISVAGERRGGGAAWSDALRLARGVDAAFALIRSQDHAIYPRAKARIAASPRWLVSAGLWSMSRVRSFRKLLATGEAECEALVDVMAAAAPPAVAVQIAAMKPR